MHNNGFPNSDADINLIHFANQLKMVDNCNLVGNNRKRSYSQKANRFAP